MTPTIWTGKGNLNDDAAQGDTFDSHHQPVSGSVVRFLWGVQDGSNYYYAEADEGAGTVEVGVVDGGAETTLDSQSSVTIPTGEWCQFTVEWTAGGDHTVWFYDSSDTELAQVGPVTETTYSDGGHGWAELGGVVSYHDYALFASPGSQTSGSFFEVVIDDTQNVDPGGTADVDYTVDNTGQQDDTQNVTLEIDGSEVDDEDLTVVSGGSQSSTLQWATSSGDEGDHTAEVLTENDNSIATIGVGGDFQPSIVSTNSPVSEGEDLDVSFDVVNNASYEVTRDVWLVVGGTERDRLTITVSGGGADNVTLTWSTSSGDAGDYTAEAQTPHGQDTVSVTVQSLTGDKIYATDDVDTVYILDNSDLSVVTSTTVSGTSNPAGIVYYDGRLFLSTTSTLFEYDPNDLSELQSVNDTESSKWLTHDGTNLWGAGGSVAKYDPSDLSVLATGTKPGSDSLNDVEYDGNHIFAVGGDAYVAKYRISDASRVAENQLESSGSTNMVFYYNGNLYVGTGVNNFHKIDPSDLSIIDTYGGSDNVNIGMFDDTYVYAGEGSSASTIVQVDSSNMTSTGNSVTLNDRVYNAMSQDGTNLWAGDDGGYVYKIDPDTMTISAQNRPASDIQDVETLAWSHVHHSGAY